MKKLLCILMVISLIFTTGMPFAVVLADDSSSKKIINIPFSSFNTATDGLTTSSIGVYGADAWSTNTAAAKLTWLEKGAVQIFSNTAISGSQYLLHGFKNSFPVFSGDGYKVVGKFNMAVKEGGGYYLRLINSSGSSVITFAELVRTSSVNNLYKFDIPSEDASSYSDVKTVLENISLGTYVNVMFILDVTASDGTNTMTYFVNGEKFTTSLAKSVVTAGHNRVRFQNGNASVAEIDNAGMYSVMKSDLPEFKVIESSLDSDMYITFSNEITKESFIDSQDSASTLITLKSESGVATKIPASAISVENDNVTLKISASALGTSKFTLTLGDTAVDVLGTAISGTKEFSFTPEKKLINIPFSSFDNENDNISYTVSSAASSQHWYPSATGAIPVYLEEEGAIQFFNSTAAAGGLSLRRALSNTYPQMSSAPYKIVGKLNMKMVSGRGAYFRMINASNSSVVTFFGMNGEANSPSSYKVVGVSENASAHDDLSTISTNVAPNEWVNALFVIDVTASDGTNTVTYYVNDTKFVASLDKSVITARHPYVRFQNDTYGVAAADNIGMYTVFSNDLPEFTASYNGDAKIDITSSEGIKIDFSNEIAKVNFANPADDTLSVFKLTRSGAEEITVPMENLSVSNDNLSIIISPEVLTTNSDYELVMTHKVKDVFGQEITGNTTFNFSTLKKETVINIPFTSFENGEGYSTSTGASKDNWSKLNAGTTATFNSETENVTLFRPSNGSAGSEQFGRILTNNYPTSSQVPYKIVGKLSLSLNAGGGVYYRFVNSAGSSVAPIIQAICSNTEGRVYFQIPKEGCKATGETQNIYDMDKTINHLKYYDDMLDIVYVIDVTDSDGTNTVTYYTDGAKFETSYDKSIILNNDLTMVRFQNGVNTTLESGSQGSRATIDNLGIYSILGSNPDFTASLVNTVVDSSKEDLKVKFSTEVFINDLKSFSNAQNSIFTIKDEDGTETVVPISDVSILGDANTVVISSEDLLPTYNYTLKIDEKAKDIFGTTISGNTSLNFSVISSAAIDNAVISATSSQEGHDASLTTDRYDYTYWMAANKGVNSVEYAFDEEVTFNNTAVNFLNTAPSYKIYSKLNEADEYELIVDNTNNIKSGIVKDVFDLVTAKYVKIEILENRLTGHANTIEAKISDFGIFNHTIDTSNVSVYNPDVKKVSYGNDGINTSSGTFGKYAVYYGYDSDITVPFALKNETSDGFNVSDSQVTFTNLPQGVTYTNGRLTVSKDTAANSIATYTDADGNTREIIFTRNLALYKNVYESTSSSAGSNAVDGDNTTSWVSSTISNPSTENDILQYAVVDLGEEMTINKVKFSHKVSFNNADRINTFSILVSNDNENFEIVKPTEFASGTDGEIVFLFGDVNARYIKYSAALQTSGNRYATLDDIAVYATKAEKIEINTPSVIVPSDEDAVLLDATVYDAEGDITVVTNAPVYTVNSDNVQINGRELKVSADCDETVITVTASFGGKSALKNITINQVPSIVNFTFDKEILENGDITAKLGARSLAQVADKELILIIARYNAAGNMIDADSTKINTGVSNEYIDFSVSLLNMENVTSQDCVKAFVFDKTTNAPILKNIGIGNCNDEIIQNEKEVGVTEFYLCIGQSNMAGYQNKIPEENNFDGVPIPEGIYLWNKESQFVAATHPYAQYSTAASYDGTSYQTANAQINMVYSFSLNMREDMPSYNNLGFVVNPRSGSAINQWSKGNTQYNFYAEAVRHCQEAMEQGAVLKGILWHQGESNRTDTTYLTQLYTLVNNLRKDLNAPDVPFILGEVNVRTDVNYESSLQFNKRISYADEMIPNCLVVSSDGCTTPDNDTSHFNRASQILLGNRYYEQYKKIVNE